MAVALSEVHQGRYGLSINAWKILSVVDCFGPLSAVEAGNHTSLEPAKISRTTDILVDRGLVLRREDPTDRRRVTLKLSAKGKTIHDEIEAASRAIESECLSVLTAAERDVLKGALVKLEERTREPLIEGDEKLRIPKPRHLKVVNA